MGFRSKSSFGIALALSINAEGKITRASIVYDSRDLSASSRSELAAFTLEPLQ